MYRQHLLQQEGRAVAGNYRATQVAGNYRATQELVQKACT